MTAVSPRTSIWRVVEFHLVSARAYWKSALITGVVTPTLYLAALGVGLGSVVNNHHGLTVPYLVFVGPGLVTAAALQRAAGEAMFPVMGGFEWQRVYHAMVATPLTPRQVCDAQLTWIALRTTVAAAVYLAILGAFGGAQRWQIVLALPAAVLAAVAFAAPVMVFTTFLRANGSGFNIIIRFALTPMFLFAGTFYPIDQLPTWGQWVARVTPLYHGTQLARGAAMGGLSPASVLGHVGYLLVWLVAGLLAARWRFRLRLTE